MTFAITKVQAYGQEAEEPLNKRYRQFLMLDITAANTDVDLDLGDNAAGSLGTFWTAADGTATGLAALGVIQDIVTRAEAFDRWGGNWTARAQADASQTAVSGITSSAGAGGGATEAMVATGLLTTDTVLSVTQKTKGANDLPLLGWSTQAANAITGIWSADPGAGAVVQVTLSRAGVTTVAAGTFQVTFANKTPNFLFVTGDAPTAYQVSLEWVLQPEASPVEFYQTA